MADIRQLDAVGIGLAFPFQFNQGGVQLTANTLTRVPSEDVIGQGVVSRASKFIPTRDEQATVVKDSIKRIIGTPQGSRFMRGDLGSLVSDLLFEVGDDALANLALAYAQVAIEQQEPRVVLLDAQAQVSDDDPTVMVAYLPVRIKSSDQVANVAVPMIRGGSQ